MAAACWYLDALKDICTLPNTTPTMTRKSVYKLFVVVVVFRKTAHCHADLNLASVLCSTRQSSIHLASKSIFTTQNLSKKCPTNSYPKRELTLATGIFSTAPKIMSLLLSYDSDNQTWNPPLVV